MAWLNINYKFIVLVVAFFAGRAVFADTVPSSLLKSGREDFHALIQDGVAAEAKLRSAVEAQVNAPAERSGPKYVIGEGEHIVVPSSRALVTTPSKLPRQSENFKQVAEELAEAELH